jgi:hypothetical protein
VTYREVTAHAPEWRKSGELRCVGEGGPGRGEKPGATAGTAQRQAGRECGVTAERKKIGASRLFPVDVGNDPRVLRSRHPHHRRYVIAPAGVRLSYESGTEPSSGAKKIAAITGRIDTILVSEMAVP